MAVKHAEALRDAGLLRGFGKARQVRWWASRKTYYVKRRDLVLRGASEPLGGCGKASQGAARNRERCDFAES